MSPGGNSRIQQRIRAHLTNRVRARPSEGDCSTLEPRETGSNPDRSGERRRAAGFTLIELIAVALLMALVAAVAIPNLGLRSSQAVLNEALSLASLLEFARQRAVMTGTPQRVVLDLDEQRYWLEDLARPEPEPATANLPGERIRWSEGRALPMQAPREAERVYRPTTGPASRPFTPIAGVWIAAVDTAEGRALRGQVHLPFAWDGSSEATDIWIAGDAGDQVRVSLAPLADRIRIERVQP